MEQAHLSCRNLLLVSPLLCVQNLVKESMASCTLL